MDQTLPDHRFSGMILLTSESDSSTKSNKPHISDVLISGTHLHLVTINWTAEGTGTTNVTIEVDTLVDPNYTTIGLPGGIGNTVTVN